jgi:hypothetical protein
MRFAGELAALATALCFASSANLFATAGRTMGAVRLNRLRIVVASVLLAAALWVTHGAHGRCGLPATSWWSWR